MRVQTYIQTDILTDATTLFTWILISTRSSKTLVEKLVESRGGLVLWTPKFHPEFAPIECVYRDVAREIRLTNIAGISAGG
jgi:transposase